MKTTSATHPTRLAQFIHLRLLVKLHIVGREQALLAVKLSSPPVFIRELNVGDLPVFGEADFCNLVSNHVKLGMGSLNIPLSSAAS